MMLIKAPVLDCNRCLQQLFADFIIRYIGLFIFNFLYLFTDADLIGSLDIIHKAKSYKQCESNQNDQQQNQEQFSYNLHFITILIIAYLFPCEANLQIRYKIVRKQKDSSKSEYKKQDKIKHGHHRVLSVCVH